MGIQTPDDVQIGRIVHLYPQTKTASPNVHRMLTVSVVKDPALHWPFLIVSWREAGELFWEKVHRDNIRLRSPLARTKADDRQGDGATESTRGAKPGRVRVMPGKKPVAFEDQMELF